MSEQTSHSESRRPGVINPGGAHPVVLVCEHASAHIPEDFHGLGLSAEDQTSHIAWDPGAFDVARHMAQGLDAPLVYSSVSRLVYDCNRPPDAPGAMPTRSEATDIPGNANLTEVQRADRIARYYRPFEALLAQTIAARATPPILVTIHSFTPVYLGQSRAVEVGLLHGADSRLADALLHVAGGRRIERNAPYGPEDGVMHTLQQHALPRGLLNVMIEVRNDLIATPEACADIGGTLTGWLTAALDRLTPETAQEGGP